MFHLMVIHICARESKFQTCGLMDKALVVDTIVAGSSPARVAFGPVKLGISSIGRVRRSQRRGSGIETRIVHLLETKLNPLGATIA